MSPPSLLSDRALVEAVRMGDVGARAVLLERHMDVARRAISSFRMSPSDAEDAMQDTLVVLTQKAASWRGDCAFSSFVFRVGQRVALDRLRRMGRARRRLALVGNVDAFEFEDCADESASADQVIEDRERQHVLVWALGEVSREQREMLLAHYSETGSGSQGTTGRVRLHRARGAVRAAIAAGGRRDLLEDGEDGGKPNFPCLFLEAA